MGTCMAACGNNVRRPSEMQHSYIDNTVAHRIEQQLEPNLPSTDEQNLQTKQISSQKSLPQPTPEVGDDLVVQIEPEAQRSDRMKSTKGNKSRFYHQKQSGESTLCEQSISLRLNERQSNMESSIVSSKKKRRSNRRDTTQSSEFQEITEESSKQNTNKNVNYYSYTKDPTCLYSQKLPMPSTEGLNSQDDYIISLTQKYTLSTPIMQEVHFKDDSVYQGEWMSGMKHGMGTLTWQKNKYQGEFKFNQFWGKGCITFKNGITYEGDMKENAAWGQGQLRLPDGSYYKGSWENNKQHGFGVHEWSRKEKYQGQWVNGLKQGDGALTFQDGSYYKGSFVLNQIHGQGQYHYFNKMTYAGEWQHNQKCGSGSLHFTNGDVYKGSFSHDKMHGVGVYVDAQGRSFEGTWINGKRQGVFVCTNPDGSKVKSQWYYGKLIRTIDDCEVSLGRNSKKR